MGRNFASILPRPDRYLVSESSPMSSAMVYYRYDRYLGNVSFVVDCDGHHSGNVTDLVWKLKFLIKFLWETMEFRIYVGMCIVVFPHSSQKYMLIKKLTYILLNSFVYKRKRVDCVSNVNPTGIVLIVFLFVTFLNSHYQRNITDHDRKNQQSITDHVRCLDNGALWTVTETLTTNYYRLTREPFKVIHRFWAHILGILRGPLD